MKGRWTAFFAGGAAATLVIAAVVYLPPQFDRKSRRPQVPTDWLKARAFEWRSGSATTLAWPIAGERTWFWPELRFGAREFLTQDGSPILVFGPDGDGPFAYILTPDNKLYASFDDAASLGLMWNEIRVSEKDRYAKGVLTNYLRGWRELP